MNSVLPGVGFSFKKSGRKSELCPVPWGDNPH
jgi:hypothetical protein